MKFIVTPHFWSAIALVLGVFAPVVPDPWGVYVKAGATAATGLVTLFLSWQRGPDGGVDGLPSRALSNKEIDSLATAFVDKTKPEASDPRTSVRAH